MAYFNALLRLFVLVAMVGTLYVRINAQEGLSKNFSYSDRYVRSHTPTRSMLYAFEIDSEKLLSWILKNRAIELASPDAVELLGQFPSDVNNLCLSMWEGKSKYDRLALICHRIAFQSPALYQRFWRVMYQAYKQHKGTKTLEDFFSEINTHLRALFLRAMISCAMVSDGSSLCEQLNKDFSWYVSRGFAKGFTSLQLIELCKYAVESRTDVTNRLKKTGDIYHAVEGIGLHQLCGRKRKTCVRLDGVRCYKKRRLTEGADNPVVEIIIDKDRYFECILMRGTTDEQRRSLEHHLCAGLEEGEIHPDEQWVQPALEYAQRQKEIHSIMKYCYQENQLGPDVLELQKKFIYP